MTLELTIPKSVKLPVVDVVFFLFLEDDFSSMPHFLAGVLATILDLLAAGVSQLALDCWFAISETVGVATFFVTSLDSLTGLSHVLKNEEKIQCKTQYKIRLY